VPRGGVHDDRARGLVRRVVDRLAPVFRRQFFQRDRRQGKAAVLTGHIGGIVDLRRGRLGQTGLDQRVIAYTARQQRRRCRNGQKPE